MKTAKVGYSEVSIQVLRVDGKKMTLQFLKQIPVVPYFATDAELDLTLSPWGRVVYTIAKEGREWLLAERDGKLYRCCIDIPSTSDWQIHHYSKGISFYKAKIQEYKSNPSFESLISNAEKSLKEHIDKLNESTSLLELSKETLQNYSQQYASCKP